MATDNESKRTTSRRWRPRPAAGKDWDRERYRAQIEQMLRDVNNETFNSSRKVRVIPYPESKDLADTRFLHREDTILTRDSDRGGGAPNPRHRCPSAAWPPSGPSPARADPRTDRAHGSSRAQTAVSAVEAVNAVLGRGVVTLDRVLHLTSSSACPATEPIPASGVPVPGIPRHRKLGRGVKVAVIDTGLHASTRASGTRAPG